MAILWISNTSFSFLDTGPLRHFNMRESFHTVVKQHLTHSSTAELLIVTILTVYYCINLATALYSRIIMQRKGVHQEWYQLHHFFQSLGHGTSVSHTDSKACNCVASLPPSDKPMKHFTKVDNQKRELVIYMTELQRNEKWLTLQVKLVLEALMIPRPTWSYSTSHIF